MHNRRQRSIPITIIMLIAFLAGGLFVTLPTRSFAESAGYALYFDGVNDYVTLNKTELMLHSNWRNEKTVHLWVRPMGNSKVCQFPVPGWCDNIFGDRPRWWGISRGVINGQDGIWIWNNSETLRIDYTIGEWVNIALVHSGGMLRAYKNGVEVGSVPSGTTLQPPAQPVLQLGGVINTTTRVWAFEGEMDEVRLWNRGLSAAEISGSMFNSLSGSEPDLAAYYKMSNGSGLSLTDDSGHGWTGTLLDGGGIVPPNGAPPLWVISGAFGVVPVTDTPTLTMTNTPGPVTDTPTPTITDTPGPVTDTPTPTNTFTPAPPTPTPGAGALFSDGFESGSFSAWSSAVTDSGDLSAQPAAALDGSFGMQALINNTTPIYVRDDTPAAESHYRASFLFDPNSISMANGNHHLIFMAYSPTNSFILRIEFQFVSGQYQARASALSDSNTWAVTPWATLSDAPHLLELDWQASSAPGANNGSLGFWSDGLLIGQVNGIDNDTLRIEHARLGAISGIDPQTAGVYYFDAFASFNTSRSGGDPTATPSGPTNTPTMTFTPSASPLPPSETPTPTITNTPGPVTDTPTPTNTFTPAPPTPTPGAGALFSDGFESGSFSAWSSAVTDSGDLSAQPAAALDGSFGMQALINNTTPIYVRDDTPASESHYRASFLFDPNSISMANGNHHIIFMAYSPTNSFILRIEFQFVSGQYQARASALSDSNTWAVTPWATLSDAPHLLELDWQASSAPGANNGSLGFWSDGLLIGQVNGIDNDTLRIEHARLGAISGIDGQTVGTYYFDAFASFNTPR